jgi:hypothetical protein
MVAVATNAVLGVSQVIVGLFSGAFSLVTARHAASRCDFALHGARGTRTTSPNLLDRGGVP